MKKNTKEISNGVKVHFVGIGGIGVSALAKYYFKKGWKVSGSDLVSSEVTEALKKLGVKIFIGRHKTKSLPKDADLVIYSPAVQKNNPELKKACKLQTTSRKLQIMNYPQALGELTKKYFTIAVSGTHGKSTTTCMIGLLLAKAGFDPTVIVGTKLKEFGDSNCRVGRSPYLVIEADEHMASFLNYWPKIIVLTTIESDHLDYYKNLKNILRTFGKYISQLPKDGVLVINNDDNNIRKMLISNSQFLISKPRRRTSSLRGKQTSKFKILKYSLKQRETKKIKKILKVPGKHNVSNALAALTVARILKIPDRISFKALSEYKGCWRRFEIKQLTINNKQITFISDYGHHPTEIKATLKAAREKYPKRKIWCVFQPHQYQRTYYLFGDFVKVFKKTPIDELIITDVYDVAGREEKKIKGKINSEELVKAINKPQVIYLPKEKIIKYLRKRLKGREVVVIMGAGDIYQLSVKLKAQSEKLP